MFKNLKVVFICLFGAFILVGCKADNAEVTSCTSDIEDAVAGKVIEVPEKELFELWVKIKKSIGQISCRRKKIPIEW